MRSLDQRRLRYLPAIVCQGQSAPPGRRAAILPMRKSTKVHNAARHRYDALHCKVTLHRQAAFKAHPFWHSTPTVGCAADTLARISKPRLLSIHTALRAHLGRMEARNAMPKSRPSDLPVTSWSLTGRSLVVSLAMLPQLWLAHDRLRHVVCAQVPLPNVQVEDVTRSDAEGGKKGDEEGESSSSLGGALSTDDSDESEGGCESNGSCEGDSEGESEGGSAPMR